MITSSKITVATPTLEYNQWLSKWSLPKALLGGTRTMKDKAKEYLPPHEDEDDTSYNLRLQSASLVNMFGKTVNALSSRPFGKKVHFETNSQVIKDIAANPLGANAAADLNVFGRLLLEDMLAYNFCHFLVDFPVVTDDAGAPRKLSLHEQRTLKAYPYFTHISPLALIERSSELVGGVEVLTRIRYLRTTIEAVGDWGQVEHNEVVVMYPTYTEVYRQDPTDTSKWELFSTAVNTLGYIALVTTRAQDSDRLPLQDLADANLRHWQSQADQNHILHVVRVPMLQALGVDSDDLKGFKVSVSTCTTFQGDSQGLSWVEHNGAGIEAGRTDLKDLVDYMIMLGADVAVGKTNGSATATGRLLDEAEVISDLQAYVRALEASFNLAFNIAIDWVRELIVVNTTTFEIRIFQDFNLNMKSQEELKQLTEARKAKDVSRRTFLVELKRRGLFNSSFDVDAELTQIASESATDTSDTDENSTDITETTDDIEITD